MHAINHQAHYNAVAKFLHWLIALAIVGMLAVGWIMEDDALVNGPLRFSLFQWHKSIGITILVLSLLRLGWRLMNPPPPLPAAMPQWERWAAHAAHILFYALMIGLPLSGWAMVSASPYSTVLYGLVPLPNLPFIADMPDKKAFGEMAEEFHCVMASATLGLLLLHIAAAWKHHLFERDDVLLRMAPRFAHGLLRRLRGGQ